MGLADQRGELWEQLVGEIGVDEPQKVHDGAAVANAGLAKRYVEGRLHLEIHVRSHVGRVEERHWLLRVQSAGSAADCGRDELLSRSKCSRQAEVGDNGCLGGRNQRRAPMFVVIPKSIQHPEDIAVRVASSVWLKPNQ